MVKSLALVFRATSGSLYNASAVFAVERTPDNSLLSLSSISCAFSDTTGCVAVFEPEACSTTLALRIMRETQHLVESVPKVNTGRVKCAAKSARQATRPSLAAV